VLTGNSGLRVGLKLLQCQFGNEKLCAGSLSGRKINVPKIDVFLSGEWGII